MIWFLIGYMWLFMHRPFEIYPMLGAIRFERLYVLLMTVLWFTVSKKEWTENRINAGLCGLGFVIFFSSLVSPYQSIMDNIATQEWFKIFYFYLLIMTSVKKESDLKKLTAGFTICFFIYMLHSYREFINGRGRFEMGIWRMMGVDVTLGHPNSFGVSICYAATMLLPFVTQLKKKWHWLFLLAYVLLSIRCVQLTGSRSSLITLLAFFTCITIASKHRLKAIPVVIILAPIAWLVIPDELKERYLSLLGSSDELKAGDAGIAGRTAGFWDGLRNFQTSPIWGIGLDCSHFITGFATHNLYGQVIGETGIAGITAFLFLLAAVTGNQLQVMNNYKELKAIGREEEALYAYRVSTATCMCYALLLFNGLASHNLDRYNLLWFGAFQGIALAILDEKMRKIKQAILRGIDPKTIDLSS
ncbi:MAG: O-antigen ligase family protein [Planctomycetaceae bacterium]|jgi:O-antigen ligase|nr:O-antigen ligase family protein [Planctomycetaceae bacterium]